MQFQKLKNTQRFEKYGLVCELVGIEKKIQPSPFLNSPKLQSSKIYCPFNSVLDCMCLFIWCKNDIHRYRYLHDEKYKVHNRNDQISVIKPVTNIFWFWQTDIFFNHLKILIVFLWYFQQLFFRTDQIWSNY